MSLATLCRRSPTGHKGHPARNTHARAHQSSWLYVTAVRSGSGGRVREGSAGTTRSNKDELCCGCRRLFRCFYGTVGIAAPCRGCLLIIPWRKVRSVYVRLFKMPFGEPSVVRTRNHRVHVLNMAKLDSHHFYCLIFLRHLKVVG